MKRRSLDEGLRALEAEARKAIVEGFDFITETINAHELLAVCIEVRELREKLAKV